MYCPTCRQERVGGFAACVACGAILVQRSREELEAELSHINFLLNDMGRWDDGEISVPARKYVRGRYQQMARVLKAVLEAPQGEAPEVRSWQEPQKPAQPERAEPPAPSVVPPVPLTVVAQPEAVAEVPVAKVVPPPEQVPVAKVVPPAPKKAPLPPPAPVLPAFEVPENPTAEEQLLQEASAWDEVWKPFLYERIGWFIGAFLILAGSFYFVAVSWSGMSALMQTLVVFGLTAGYATAFSVGGALLGRKENFGSAGRVLMLIGSAVAPLASLALHPAQSAQQIVTLPLCIAWSFAAAVLFGVVAKQVDPESQRPLQMLMLISTALMGLAPLLAPFGTPMLWLNAVPVALIYRAWTRSDSERKSDALWFLICAPLYLLALHAIRLHLALDAAQALPSVATYAPFLAVLAAGVLRLRELPKQRSADALSVGVIALQVALVIAAGFGEAPALFIGCAVLGLTSFQLSLGTARRARWLYGTYAAAQLAYQTAGQLVPGILKTLIAEAKSALGYAPTAPLPFNFDSVIALPFILAAAVLAIRMQSRAEKDERSAAIADVLFRSTAGASLFFTAIAFAGNDLRAALWTVPVLALLCLGLGQWYSRRFLTLTGAFLLVTTPIFSTALFGAPMAAVLTGLAALFLAGLSVIQTKTTRDGVSAAAGLLAASAVALAWTGAPSQLSGVIAVLLGGGAALLVSRNLDKPLGISLSVAVLVSAVPLFFLHQQPEAAPFSVAVAGLALALLASRGGRYETLDWVAGCSVLIACAWNWLLQETHGLEAASVFHLPLLGPTLITAGLTLLTISRRQKALESLGAALLILAAFPTVPSLFTAWSFMTPVLSAAILCAVSLASSLLTAKNGRSATSVLMALLALMGTGLAAVLSHNEAGWPIVPTMVLMGATALFSARALHPSFSVPYAALIAIGILAWDGHTNGLLLVAVALSAIALIPEHEALHEWLLDSEAVSLAASLSSAAALLTISIKLDPSVNPLVVAATALLPLAWVRGSRMGWLGVLIAPLLGLYLFSAKAELALYGLIPLAVVLFTRAASQLSLTRRLLTDDEDALAKSFVRATLVGYALFAVGVLGYGGTIELFGNGASMRQLDTLLLEVAAGFLLAAGSPLWLRLLASSLVAAFVPAAQPFLMPALLALGFLTHHLPKAMHAALGAEESPRTVPSTAIFAIALTFLPWLQHVPTNGQLLITAAALLGGSLLLRARWMVTAGALLAATTSFGFAPLDAQWLAALPRLETIALVALLSSLAAAALARESRNLSAQAWTRLLAPGFDKDLHQPLWISAAGALLFACLMQVEHFGAETFALLPGLALLGSGVLLAVTRERAEAALAVALSAAVIVFLVPLPWVPVVLAGFALAVCALGHKLEGRAEIADALHHAGWVVALAAVFFNRSLHHLATPLSFGLGALTAWVVVKRRPAREPLAWSVTLLAGHVLLFHLGVVLSTGKPATYIFPYIGALSAIAATLALSFASEQHRRSLGLVFAALAGVEILCGVLLLPLGAEELALREGLVGAGGMALLVISLSRWALREEDTIAAYGAQLALLLGYLALRVHGFLPHGLRANDAVAALVGGALFSGLHGWVRRQDEQHVFARPLWVGAVGLPLLGLFVAPWSDPLVVAALMVGYATHFAAAARMGEGRRLASVLSVGAFNAALLFAWMGSHVGEAQYYVIPAGLSLLLLVRSFREDFSEGTSARLRAVAITAIYLASAWPVLFDHTWQMLACAAICVVGVAAGVALRIRSYVYLGTGFLVSTIVANLARFGVRDPRLGAVFLSLLGLAIVGFMVFMTARRAELLARYRRVREMLDGWEG